jgi:hypothetical protein
MRREWSVHLDQDDAMNQPRLLFSLRGAAPAATAAPAVAFPDVQRPQDLPPFLLAGPLDVGAFESTANGWHACWRYGAEDVAFSIRYDRGAQEAAFEASAAAMPPLFGRAVGTTSAEIARHLAVTLPGWLRAAIQPSLETRAHLRLLPATAADVIGLPAGPFAVLALPLPFDWLGEFVDWHRSAWLDTRLRTACGVHVCEVPGSIIYRDRRRIPLEQNRRLAEILAQASGQPTDLRAREQADGRIEVAVSRTSTLALFLLPLAAVPRLVDVLLAERFLASARFAASASALGPFGAESAALLLPVLALTRGDTVHVDDALRAVSASYPLRGLGSVLDPAARGACEPPTADDALPARHYAPPGIEVDADGRVRFGRLDNDGAALAAVAQLWLKDDYALGDEEAGPGSVCAVSRRRS